MGVSQSPDIAQEIMEDLFCQLDEVDVYIDDIGVFNNSWQAHLASLNKVLSILQDANFTVNPLKCEWGVHETDWLGYCLTPTGLKPCQRKFRAFSMFSNLLMLNSYVLFWVLSIFIKTCIHVALTFCLL